MSFKVKFLSDNNNENDINKNNIIFFKNDSIVFILKKDVSLNKNEFYDAHDHFFS